MFQNIPTPLFKKFYSLCNKIHSPLCNANVISVQDLQKFLDESTHGAILFSLGTNLKSSQLSNEKRKMLMDAFKELAPVRILWKFEKDDLPGKPENVLIKKWLPQNDILGNLFFYLWEAFRIISLDKRIETTWNWKKCLQGIQMLKCSSLILGFWAHKRLFTTENPSSGCLSSQINLSMLRSEWEKD